MGKFRERPLTDSRYAIPSVAKLKKISHGSSPSGAGKRSFNCMVHIYTAHVVGWMEHKWAVYCMAWLLLAALSSVGNRCILYSLDLENWVPDTL